MRVRRRNANAKVPYFISRNKQATKYHLLAFRQDRKDRSKFVRHVFPYLAFGNRLAFAATSICGKTFKDVELVSEENALVPNRCRFCQNPYPHWRRYR